MRKVILGLLILFVSTSVLGFDLEGWLGSLSGDEVTNLYYLKIIFGITIKMRLIVVFSMKIMLGVRVGKT